MTIAKSVGLVLLALLFIHWFTGGLDEIITPDPITPTHVETIS